MPWCNGCRRDFPQRSAYAVHRTRTKNPACQDNTIPEAILRAYRRAASRTTSSTSSGSDSGSSTSESDSESEDELDEDSREDAAPEPRYFQGDYFGDSYAPADLPGWSTSHGEDAMDEDEDEEAEEVLDNPSSLEEDEDGLAELAAANEAHWEPVRPEPSLPGDDTGSESNPSSSTHLHTPPSTTEPAARPSADETKRKRMENALRHPVTIVEYPSDVAGSPISAATAATDNSNSVPEPRRGADAEASAPSDRSSTAPNQPGTQTQSPSVYDDYKDLLKETVKTAASSDNIYAPFNSKMDWEIARWAKLRGPGSTAFTELLGIEGVRAHPFVSQL